MIDCHARVSIIYMDEFIFLCFHQYYLGASYNNIKNKFKKQIDRFSIEESFTLSTTNLDSRRLFRNFNDWRSKSADKLFDIANKFYGFKDGIIFERQHMINIIHEYAVAYECDLYWK